MKNRIGFTTLWALSLILVYLMARTAQPTSGSSSASSAEANTATSAPTERVVYKEGQTTEKIVVIDRSERRQRFASFDEIGSPNLDASAIQNQLPGALVEGGDIMQKNLLVAEVLASLTPENVHVALQAFENAPRNPLNDHNFRMFMRAWGEIDGQAAAEYAFFNEEGKKVHWGGTLAMSGWGANDPEAALAFVSKVDEDNRSRGYMLDGLIRGWSTTDLKGASDYVTNMEDRGHANKLVEHLAQEHIKQTGPGAALAWADRVGRQHDDPKFAGHVINEVAVFAAREDPFTARDWLENNLESDFMNPRIFEEVADELTEVDANAGAAFLDQHFDDPRVNGKVIAETVEEWARKDPASAAEWLDQYAGHEKINGEVVHELAGEWAGSDPDSAIAWVSNLKNPGLQQKGLASVVDHWTRDDPTAVGEWLNGQTQRGDLFDSAIEVYANRIAQKTPIAALSWAQQIQNEERREKTTVRAGQAMFRQDQDAVLSWLPTSGLSERAQNAILHPPKDQRRDWDRRR